MVIEILSTRLDTLHLDQLDTIIIHPSSIKITRVLFEAIQEGQRASKSCKYGRCDRRRTIPA